MLRLGDLSWAPKILWGITIDIGEDLGGELGLYGLNGGSGDVIEEQEMGGLKLVIGRGEEELDGLSMS